MKDSGRKIRDDAKHTERSEVKAGWPDTVYLQNFGFILSQVFNAQPYVVGSVTNMDNKWRDIDVVVVLKDEEFMKMFPEGDITYSWKWEWTCAAWSELGKKITGLPIDFKIQSETISNSHHLSEKHKPMNPIGLKSVKRQVVLDENPEN